VRSRKRNNVRRIENLLISYYCKLRLFPDTLIIYMNLIRNKKQVQHQIPVKVDSIGYCEYFPLRQFFGLIGNCPQSATFHTAYVMHHLLKPYSTHSAFRPKRQCALLSRERRRLVLSKPIFLLTGIP